MRNPLRKCEGEATAAINPTNPCVVELEFACTSQVCPRRLKGRVVRKSYTFPLQQPTPASVAGIASEFEGEQQGICDTTS